MRNGRDSNVALWLMIIIALGLIFLFAGCVYSGVEYVTTPQGQMYVCRIGGDTRMMSFDSDEVNKYCESLRGVKP